MDEGQSTAHTSIFETIKLDDQEYGEHWSARDLSRILEYALWQKFKNVLEKAEKACENSGQAVSDHFIHVDKMITAGKGAQRKVEDVYLSRYGAYLVVQNADPSKPIVALGQTYFAVQTRRQELADEEVLAGLTEDQRRLLMRDQITIQNLQLAETASRAGVITSKDFAVFQDHGYRGLYGGLGARDIHARKGLKKGQKILDYMGGTELAANLFRITQTDESIKRKGIKEKQQANDEHHRMGHQVREFMIQESGTAPEDLPTPTKSIQQLQREEQKRLESGQQPSLFDDLEP
jgi:DNA-damage-inducible protein D